MSYLDRLAALDPAKTLLDRAAVRVLLLTGQSSFASSRLQPEQVEFLRAVSPQGAAIVESGFPFHRELSMPAPPPSLPAASVRNALQVLWTYSSPRFRTAARATLQQALTATDERLVIVTGSCGLQIANAVWPQLRLPSTLYVQLVALGPACFGQLRLAGAEVTIVQAEGDGWSRLLYRGPVHRRGAGGHLDYWASVEMRALVAEILAGAAGMEAK